MKVAKLSELEVKDVNRQREREKESHRLEQLMKRLETMRKREQSTEQKAA
jgi:hypothetical protein